MPHGSAVWQTFVAKTFNPYFTADCRNVVVNEQTDGKTDGQNKRETDATDRGIDRQTDNGQRAIASTMIRERSLKRKRNSGKTKEKMRNGKKSYSIRVALIWEKD